MRLELSFYERTALVYFLTKMKTEKPAPELSQEEQSVMNDIEAKARARATDDSCGPVISDGFSLDLSGRERTVLLKTFRQYLSRFDEDQTDTKVLQMWIGKLEQTLVTPIR